MMLFCGQMAVFGGFACVAYLTSRWPYWGIGIFIFIILAVFATPLIIIWVIYLKEDLEGMGLLTSSGISLVALFGGILILRFASRLWCRAELR